MGQNEVVKQVHAALTANTTAAIVPRVAISGSGGMGKSTLARHYAQRYARDYYGIWWIGAQSQDALIADLAVLAGHLGIRAEDHATDMARAQAAVMALSNAADPWLLIYDNAENPGDLRDWLPDGVRALITSRATLWPGYGTVGAQPLDPQRGADLLMAEAQRSDDRAGAVALSDALGGLPLALVLAGAWLRDTPGTPFAEYEARIDALLATPPEAVAVHDYPLSVFATVKLSIDKLSDNAALLLRIFAYLDPDDLWPGLVTDLADEDPDDERYEPIPDALWTLAKDRAEVERSFADLIRHSLLERDDATPANRSPGLEPGSRRNNAETLDQDHRGPGARPGMQSVEATANRSPGQRSGASTNDAPPLDQDHRDPGAGPGMQDAEAIANHSPASSAGQGSGLDTPHRLHRLTATIQRSLEHFPAKPERLGVAKMRQNDKPETLERSTIVEKALDAATQRPTAAALLAAGYPDDLSPRYIENWPACARRAPAIAALAETPPETAAMDYLLNQASIWLDAQRRDDLALTYAETALRLTEARLGPDHEMVGIACNNLATSYWRKGRLAEAEPLAARALAIADATDTPESTRAIRLNTHGLMLQKLADTLPEPARGENRARAARRYQEAIGLGRKLDFKPRLVTPWINNLATLRATQGRWTAALPLHGRALALRRAALSPNDPDIAESLLNLGKTLLLAGRGRRGYRGTGCLDMLAESLAIFEAAFLDAPDHPHRIIAAETLAIAHRLLARPGPSMQTAPITGTLQPDPAEAGALETRYTIDPTLILAVVEDYADRERLFTTGTEPPPP